MSKILINKNTGSLVDTKYFEINLDYLNSKYNKKIDNSINELQSNDTTLFLDKDKNESNEDKINQFLVDYDNTKILMTDEQLFNFYETVKADLPFSFLNGNKIKTSIINVKNSQGILITNKNNIINNRQYVYLNKNKFNAPHTYTTWIKPNSKNFQRKTLIRNELIFTVEGYKKDIQNNIRKVLK